MVKDRPKFQISEQLTIRENEILFWICQGLSNKEISEKICRSLRTIEGHRNNLLKKTGAKNTASLVVYAIYNDLVDIEVNVLKKSFLS